MLQNQKHRTGPQSDKESFESGLTTSLHPDTQGDLRTLHSRLRFPAGQTILEAGCGDGDQTLELAKRNPGCHITTFDHSESAIVQARNRLKRVGITNVKVFYGDLYRLPFPQASFDHLYVCRILEQQKNPAAALKSLLSMVKMSGTATLVEPLELLEKPFIRQLTDSKSPEPVNRRLHLTVINFISRDLHPEPVS